MRPARPEQAARGSAYPFEEQQLQRLQPQQEQELQRLQEVEVLLPDVPATEPLWLHLHEQVQLPEGLLLLVPPTEPEELAQHGLQQEF